MSTRVFLSSTCFDLVDLRAEVEQELRLLGLEPVLSDRPTSEFRIQPDANSIESCLANVRKADYVVVVLSQRYGPSLKSAGYADVSATHLEYLEARRLRKPILFYVRDRLEADYAIWKRNRRKWSNSLAWVREQDSQILTLLDSHRKLERRSGANNWFWTFRDSVELRTRLRLDLQAPAGKATLSRLIAEGQLPFIVARTVDWQLDKKAGLLRVRALVENVGLGPALQPFVEINGCETDVRSIPTLAPSADHPIEIVLPLAEQKIRGGVVAVWIGCSYTTVEGHVIGDENYAEFDADPCPEGTSELPFFDHAGKVYYHSRGVKTRVAETFSVPGHDDSSYHPGDYGPRAVFAYPVIDDSGEA